MFLLLAVPVLAGWRVARRVLREGDPLACGSLALGLGVAFTLLGVNGLYRVATLPVAVLATLAVQAAVAVGLGFLEDRAEPLPRRRWPSILFLAAGLGATWFYCTSWQVSQPDDDYWIHAALQGLMLHGNFPPANPFFPDIPLNGHYGRDLAIVAFTWLSGGSVFTVQFVLTNLLQCLALLIFFHALWRSTGSQAQAAWGAGFLFFGVNAGLRGGLMDTLQNNNPLVNLYLALLTDLLLRLWAGRSLSVALVAGLVLGGYAIVYETHFGLVVLAALATAALLGSSMGRRAVLATALALAVAAPIAATQGGPFTEMARRHLGGAEAPGSVGLLNQAQVVPLRFPKDPLFHILLEPDGYRRLSFAYKTETFLKRFDVPRFTRGYQPVWSWEVWRIQFLPLYLAPLSWFWLLRSRHLAGTFLASFGTAAFLVPALVDFGPVYESEYFRWMMASGVGLAGALGLACASWAENLDDGARWSLRLEERDLALGLSPRRLAWLALVPLIWLNTVTAGQHLRDAWRGLGQWGGLWRGGLRVPAPEDWLASQGLLEFEPEDVAAARWLSERVRPGDRMLVNFADDNSFRLYYESTLVALAGARSVGHAFTLDEDPVGTPPYRMAPLARAFWATRDPSLLQRLQVDWVYLKPTEDLPDLDGVPGLVLAHREGPRRLLYRFEPPAPEVAPAPGEGLALAGWRAPEGLRAGEPTPVTLVLRNGGPRDLDLGGTLVGRTRTGHPEELAAWPLRGTLRAGSTRTLEGIFVPPAGEGEFAMEWWWERGGGAVPLEGPGPSARVDFAARVGGLALDRLAVDDLRAGRLALATVDLSGWAGHWRDETVRATVAFRSDEWYVPPKEAMADLVLPARGGAVRAQVPVLVPSEPGTWRADLFLSARDGHRVRLVGPTVEVAP